MILDAAVVRSRPLRPTSGASCSFVALTMKHRLAAMLMLEEGGIE